VPGLAVKLGCGYKSKIIGDGGRKQQLIKALQIQGVTNVELIPPISRQELIECYKSADVLFLHLNDYDAFKKVLPSKVFEYAAFNKPILAGVSGYSASFIEANITNAKVFPPCNVELAVQLIEKFSYDGEPRGEFVNNYSRERIMKNMSKSILSVLPEPG